VESTQIYNVEFQYNFTDYMVVDAIFRSETVLYWKKRGSPAGATEDIHTIHLNEHTMLTGWVEGDGTICSLYSDFAEGEMFGFNYFQDGRIQKLTGTIRRKT